MFLASIIPKEKNKNKKDTVQKVALWRGGRGRDKVHFGRELGAGATKCILGAAGAAAPKMQLGAVWAPRPKCTFSPPRPPRPNVLAPL